MTTEPQPTETTQAQAIALSPQREQALAERQRAMAETTFGIGVNPFSNGDAFKLACAMADKLAASTILPEEYRNNPANVLVAIDYAARLGISPIMLAQNMDVVKGRPGLRGAFLAGLINKSPLFSRLKYEWRGQDNPGGEPTPDHGCRAYATEIATGEVVYGTWIDWRMVKGEGWHKNTKWDYMREQMFQYRAASFWSRANASDITLGMYEVEELRDAIDGEFQHVPRQTSDNQKRLEASLDAAVATVDGEDKEAGGKDEQATQVARARPRRQRAAAAAAAAPAATTADPVPPETTDDAEAEEAAPEQAADAQPAEQAVQLGAAPQNFSLE